MTPVRQYMCISPCRYSQKVLHHLVPEWTHCSENCMLVPKPCVSAVHVHGTSNELEVMIRCSPHRLYLHAGAVRIVGRGARNGSISFSFDLPPYPLVESHGQQGFEYDKAGHQPSMPHARAIALTLQHIQQDPELSAAIKGRKLCWYVLDHPLAMILNQKTPLDMRGASARRHAFLEEVTFVRRMAQQLSAKVVWYSAPSANFPNSYKLACMLCEATGWKPGVHPSGELAGFSSDIAVAVTKELK